MSEQTWKFSKGSSGSIGLLNLLGLIFVTLKLAGVGAVANWSWWAVLSPFWVPIALAVVLILFLVTLGLFSKK